MLWDRHTRTHVHTRTHTDVHNPPRPTHTHTVATRHVERTTSSLTISRENRTGMFYSKLKHKVSRLRNTKNVKTWEELTVSSFVGGIPVTHEDVSPYRSNMAGRAPNEWRSRLFKPCFSTCSSGALHLLNWPGPGCHNTHTQIYKNIYTNPYFLWHIGYQPHQQQLKLPYRLWRKHF